ncbi:MAG: tetratricopeptide repeat protein [Gammaproteobacteria bacterium]|nr:tetratricopeptide repeat protein [Gammaproteobacteria bacterium]
MALLPGALAPAWAAVDPGKLLRDAEEALGRRDLPGAATAFTAAAEASTDVNLAERASQLTFGTGFDALAERAASRWVELAPDNPLPRELRGRLKLRRHAVDEATVDLLAALGTGEPRRDEVYLALASDLSAEENAGLVTRTLARLTALDPLAPGLQLALGTAALRSGDYDLAFGAAETAALDDPEWPEPQLLMARVLAASGRDEEALAKAEAISKLAPNPLVDLEYARLLADAGKFAEAREKLAELASRFGERPEINRTLALLDLAAGDLDGADQRFDALDDSGSDRFESFYYRGQIAAERDDPETARRYFGRISSGPYLVPAQLAIAESLVRAGQSAEAVEHLTAFGFDAPAQAFDVLEYKAQILLLMKRPAEALAVYGEALQYKPTAISVLLARSALLEQEGRIREALADLERAVEIAPDDPLAANAYGYILANRTRRARVAWHYVRRAYEIQPRSAPIQDSVGWALFKLGRTEEARSHLEEALDLLPDPEIASHLADVLWKLGDRETATDLLMSAAVAFPDSKPVRDTAERLLD